MSTIRTIAIAAEDSAIRLDRWFKRHFPGLGHGRLEKLLRTGQVRLDGHRATAGDRVAAGQLVRVPPLGEIDAPAPQPPAGAAAGRRDAVAARRCCTAMTTVIVIDKPAGLAVQGGTGTDRHLDALLDALRFGAAERPRLVHRLDKDTSGVLVLARSAAAAAALAAAFRGKDVRKVYWAVDRRRAQAAPAAASTCRSPSSPGGGGERVVADDADGKRADHLLSHHRSCRRQDRLARARAGDRAHASAPRPCGGTRHAHPRRRQIWRRRGASGRRARSAPPPSSRPRHRPCRTPMAAGSAVTAPLPPHMRETWTFFGFAEADDPDPFADLAAAD